MDLKLRGEVAWRAAPTGWGHPLPAADADRHAGDQIPNTGLSRARFDPGERAPHCLAVHSNDPLVATEKQGMTTDVH